MFGCPDGTASQVVLTQRTRLGFRETEIPLVVLPVMIHPGSITHFLPRLNAVPAMMLTNTLLDGGQRRKYDDVLGIFLRCSIPFAAAGYQVQSGMVGHAVDFPAGKCRAVKGFDGTHFKNCRSAVGTLNIDLVIRLQLAEVEED